MCIGMCKYMCVCVCACVCVCVCVRVCVCACTYMCVYMCAYVRVCGVRVYVVCMLQSVSPTISLEVSLAGNKYHSSPPPGIQSFCSTSERWRAL